MPSSLGASGSLPAGYDFIQTLGAGASGWVALARQVDLGRLVAIKTLLTGVHDPAGLRRLEREGRAIVTIQHRHIVTVYALIPSAGGAALVMEYLPGGDLRTAIGSGGLTAVQAVEILANVASGLQHAHQSGIVHRDIKPENILLGAPLGRAIPDVKIADFGLARLPRAAGAFRTTPGGRSGTPAYMAPEQITAPDAETPAIDIYSFSVLAYELLTGALPFPRGDPGALLAAHLHDRPAPPWDVAPGFPVPAGQALLAGLAKNPADRPALTELTLSLQSVSAAEWDALGRGSMPSTRSGTNPIPVPTGTTTGTTGHATQAEGLGVPTSESIDTEGPEVPLIGTQHRPEGPIVVHAFNASPAPERPIAVPVYRPPKPPFIRRRAAYLTLAVGVGSVLGIVLILLARLLR